MTTKRTLQSLYALFSSPLNGKSGLCRDKVNQLVTNGLSQPYHLGESTFIIRGFGSIFSFVLHFSMKSCKLREKPQMGRRALRRLIWGYSVCLCPIKRTPGLYGLTKWVYRRIPRSDFTPRQAVFIATTKQRDESLDLTTKSVTIGQ